MRKVEVRSPTRVDLSGGTLDMWPIHSFYQEAKTINMAIDIYTYCTVEEIAEDCIHIIAPAINLDRKITNLDEYLNDDKNKADFIYPHLKYFRPSKCSIYFHSESPIGGGLGGSSSLTISILKAVSTFCGMELNDPYKMVHLAHNMEAFLLKTPTGSQDYYPPILGGALSIDYLWDGHHVKKLELASDYIDKHFMLVYTGSPHHSGMNNWTVLKDLIESNQKTYQDLEKLNQISYELYDVILNEDWEKMPELFKQEYQARTSLSPAFTSERIQLLEKIAKEHGAQAVKICGAGGGGCVFVWVDEKHREMVKSNLELADFEILKARPCRDGSRLKIS